MFKKILLSISLFWYLDDEWDWSNEYDYVRSPRQFWKNRLFKEYSITHIFKQKSLSKNQLISNFIKQYKNDDLIDGLAII